MTTSVRHAHPRTAALAALVLAALGTASCRGGGTAEAGPRVLGVRVAEPMPRAEGTAYEAAARVSLLEGDPEDHDALHNVFELSADVISGSEPHGEEAFRILHEKGIRTILSVDGKVPDADLAARYGMKYVHVPIQYKGITADEVARIAKTFREQEGPFYVHCFHGKHRGPAAAAIGRLVLDGAGREEALAEMRQWCGTSPSYEGLYATIAYGDIPSEEETRALDWDFPAAEPLEGVAGAMVLIARSNDHLKAALKNDWQPDPGHPDLNPRNEAAKLVELFERSAGLHEVAAEPADFRQWMADSIEQAASLRDVIERMEQGRAAPDAATAAYETLAATCKACHGDYRD